MAGGVLVILGLSLKEGEGHDARFVGTGMHGGRMYIRGNVTNTGREVEVVELKDDDRRLLQNILSEFSGYFDLDISEISTQEFCKVVPVSHRPYGTLYTH